MPKLKIKYNLKKGEKKVLIRSKPSLEQRLHRMCSTATLTSSSPPPPPPPLPPPHTHTQNFTYSLKRTKYRCIDISHCPEYRLDNRNHNSTFEKSRLDLDLDLSTGVKRNVQGHFSCSVFLFY